VRSRLRARPRPGWWGSRAGKIRGRSTCRPSRARPSP
jgi:hypothetical protein